MTKRRIEVVGAVLIDGRSVLAARRGPGMSLPGRWEFPGGKVEPGESPTQALARELVEELGCRIAVGAHVTTSEHEQQSAVIVLSTYYCAIVSGVPEAMEHSELRWVEASALDLLDWAPADVPAARRVMRDLA